MSISTEKAFDLLPFVVDIFEKLDIQERGKKILEDTQKANPNRLAEELQKEVGIAIMKYIAKNLPKVKDEFFQLVAIASDVDVKTAKARPLAESIQTLKDVFLDAELMDFFRAAVQ